MKLNHTYTLDLEWTGNTGAGTEKFNSYKRTFTASIKDKPIINGSADSTFHGDAELHNPEDMLLTALSSCFMLSFFYLCAKNKISVSTYTDKPIGELKLNSDGSGQFEKVTLNPKIELLNKSLNKEASTLLHQAKELCFIARSCNFPIHHNPFFI